MKKIRFLIVGCMLLFAYIANAVEFTTMASGEFNKWYLSGGYAAEVPEVVKYDGRTDVILIQVSEDCQYPWDVQFCNNFHELDNQSEGNEFKIEFDVTWNGASGDTANIYMMAGKTPYDADFNALHDEWQWNGDDNTELLYQDEDGNYDFWAGHNKPFAVVKGQWTHVVWGGEIGEKGAEWIGVQINMFDESHYGKFYISNISVTINDKAISGPKYVYNGDEALQGWAISGSYKMQVSAENVVTINVDQPGDPWTCQFNPPTWYAPSKGKNEEFEFSFDAKYIGEGTDGDSIGSITFVQARQLGSYTGDLAEMCASLGVDEVDAAWQLQNTVEQLIVSDYTDAPEDYYEHYLDRSVNLHPTSEWQHFYFKGTLGRHAADSVDLEFEVGGSKTGKYSFKNILFTVKDKPFASYFFNNFEDDNFEYEIVGGEEARVKRALNTGADTINIPSKIEVDGKELPVTGIANNAFANNDTITTVIVPASVTSIGSGAFAGSNNITSVAVAGKVDLSKAELYCTAADSIRYHLLSNTTAEIVRSNVSGDVELPEEVTMGNTYTIAGIGLEAFYGCTGLTSVSIPNTYKYIGNYAFYDCYNLKTINLPDSLSDLGRGALEYCSSLESIDIPAGVTSIAEYTFCGCNSLATAKLNSNITYIGNYAFASCSSLSSIIIPDGVTEIGYYAFNYCSNLDSIVIPNSVESIGRYAFSSCYSLKSVTLPDGITGIGERTFASCNSLSSINIPATVRRIEYEAFSNCNSMVSLTIPDSVSSISYNAFYGVKNLIYHGSYTIDSPWGAKTLNGTIDGDFIYVDEEKTIIASYIGTSADVVIPDNVKTIGYEAFSGCSTVKTVTIGKNVEAIDGYAFTDCSSLTSVTFGDKLETIDNGAFAGCSKLTSITIPRSVTEIYGNPFVNCGKLAEVKVATGSTSFSAKDGVLYNYDKTKLVCYPAAKTDTSFVIPGMVTEIGEYAVAGGYNLKSITVGDNVETIGVDAFSYCYSLTSATIESEADFSEANLQFKKDGFKYMVLDNNSVKLVQGGSYPSNVVIPETVTAGSTFTVTAIGDYTFAWNYDIESVVIPESVTSIGNNAFYYCGNLASVNIPDAVTEIGYTAFYNCYSLDSIAIGANVKSIGQRAFYNCYNLKSVQIPLSVTRIDYYAFGSIASDATITCEVNRKPANWDNRWYGYGNQTIIWGNGVLPEFEYTIIDGDEVAVSGYNGLNGVVVVPSTVEIEGETYTVTAVADNAFYNNRNIYSVSLPNTIKTIGGYAFYNCSNLTEINIPSSVTSIGSYAFYDCYNYLRNIYIPSSVATIGSYAFAYCSNLSITCGAASQPESWSDFWNYSNCPVTWNGTYVEPEEIPITCYARVNLGADEELAPALEYIVEASERVENPWDNQFFISFQPEHALVPGEQYLFSFDVKADKYAEFGLEGQAAPGEYRCGYLNTNYVQMYFDTVYTTFSYVGMVESDQAGVYTFAFYLSNIEEANTYYIKNIKFKEIYVPEEDNFQWDWWYYSGERIAYLSSYNGSASEVEIPSTVTIDGEEYTVTGISDGAFQNRNRVTNVVIPNTVRYINGSVFYNCSSLESVTIGTGVEQIASEAFYNCPNLVTVDNKSKKLNNISSYAFSNCYKLETIKLPAVKYVGTAAFGGCSNATIYCDWEGQPRNWESSWKDENATVVWGNVPLPEFEYNIYNDNGRSLAMITSYMGKGGNVVIPDTVTIDGTLYNVARINGSAFWNNDDITSVTFGKNIEYIGYRAFYDCDGLAELTLDGNMTIGNYVFQGCNNLTTVNIGGNVIVDEWAFYECNGLKTLTIGGNTTIGNYSFYNCDNLETVTIGGNVESIGEEAFYSCNNLSSVVIGDSVKTIGSSAFADGYSLRNVTIGNGVETIDNNAFYNCALPIILIPKSVTTIGNYAFGYNSYLTIYCEIAEANKPDTWSEYWNSSDRPVVWATTEIPEFTYDFDEFWHTAGVKCYNGKGGDVTIPDTVTKDGVKYAVVGIYYNAFAGTDSMEVNIPSTVTNISEGAFANCLGLAAINVDTLNTEYKSVDGVLYSSDMSYLYAYPALRPGASFEVPSEVRYINSYSFKNNQTLESVVLGENVYQVNSYAFQGSNISYVEFDDNLKYLEYEAFYNCHNLTSVEIPATLKYIRNNVFTGCQNATIYCDWAEQPYEWYGDWNYNGGTVVWGDVQLPEFSYEIISDNALRITGYYGSSADIEIPDVLAIGKKEYKVTEIGSDAFSWNDDIKSVVIGNNVTTIGSSAFYDCDSLASVIFGPNVITIYGSAFSSCESLTDVELPSSLQQIYYYAFAYNENLETVTIPSSVTTIYYDAFENDSLSTIYCEVSEKPRNWSDSWNYNGGTVVWGDAPLPEFEYTIKDDNTAELTKYYGKGGEVEIPATVTIGGNEYDVTSIGHNAFSSNRGITSAVIGDNVKTIGYDAFYDCDNLTSVTFGKNVETLESEAFYSCDYLASVTLGDNVKTIDERAFGYCYYLSSITLGNVESIGYDAFYNTSLSAILIPESVTEIGSGAFYNSNGMTIYCEIAEADKPDGWDSYWNYWGYPVVWAAASVPEFVWNVDYGEAKLKSYNGNGGDVTVPSTVTIDSVEYTVTGIYTNAFAGCNSAVAVTIPASVSYIEDNRLAGQNLTAINVDTANTYYASVDGVLYNADTTYLYYYPAGRPDGSFNIPSQVVQIWSNAFYGNQKLGAVKFGENVKYVGDWAFGRCPNLGYVELNDKLYEVYGYVFYECANLSEITIPTSVKHIYSWAFTGCTNATIYSDWTEKPRGWDYDWNQEGGTVVWGNTPLPEFDFEVITNNTARLVSYLGNGGDVVIPETATINGKEYKVTTIGSSAFYDRNNIKSVVIGNNVDTVYSSAFGSCDSLASINFGQVIYIGGSAFSSCNSLQSVELPNSVQYIGDWAFAYNRNLALVEIPNSVSFINYDAFYYDNDAIIYCDFAERPDAWNYEWNSNGGTVVWSDKPLPEFKYTIKDDNTAELSQYCGNGGAVVIPATATINGQEYNVTSIGSNAFSDKGSVTSVTIGDNVETIGQSAFSGCYHLASVTFGKKVKTIGASAFFNCDDLGSVTIGGNVETIGNDAFNDCGNLVYVVIGDSVKTIGESAFNSCYNLSSVTLGNGVKTIGGYAFYYNRELTKIVIPQSVDSLGESLFYNYNSTVTIYCEIAEADKPDSWNEYWNSGYPVVWATAEFPAFDYEYNDYSQTATVVKYNNVGGDVAIPATVEKDGVEYTVTTIARNAFGVNGRPFSLSIPATVTDIKYDAMYNCPSLTAINVDTTNTIYSSVDGVLYNAQKTALLKYPASKADTSFVVPESVKEIGNYAFRYAANLKSIDVHDGVVSIGSHVFSECDNLKTFRIPAGVVAISVDAFWGCDNLESVELHNRVKYIRDDVFCGCPSLAEITIPASVAQIGKNVFSLSENVTIYCPFDSRPVGWHEKWNNMGGTVVWSNVPLPEFIFNITDSTNRTVEVSHYNWYGPSVVVPDTVTIDGVLYTVTSIGEQAFWENNYITSVTVSSNVTHIGTYAFGECGNLTSVELPNSVVLGGYAFSNCTALTELVLPDSITIGASAFRGCYGLSEVILPASAYVDFAAFSNTSPIIYCLGDESIAANWSNAWNNSFYGSIYWNAKKLTLTANNPALGNVSGAGWYSGDSEAYVYAEANEGCEFVQWQLGDSVVSTAAGAYYVLNGNDTLTAVFSMEPDYYTVFASVNNPLYGYVTGNGAYEYNTEVTVSAVSNDDSKYRFVGWEGSSSTSSVITFTVEDSVVLVANFEVIPPTYYVNAYTNSYWVGTVSGSDYYESGTEVTVEATVTDENTIFSHWSNGDTARVLTFTVTRDVELIAYFVGKPCTVAADTAFANGTVEGYGVYEYSTNVKLRAVPAANYHFVAWSDDDRNNPRDFNIYQDTVLLSPVFAANTFAVKADYANANGTVDGYGVYEYGATAVLKATPVAGYTFSNWSDGTTENPYEFEVTGKFAVSADFAVSTFNVTAAAANSYGTIEGSADSTYAYGTELTWTATAADNCRFICWKSNGDFLTDVNSISVIVAEDMNLTAEFEQIKYDITLVADGGTISGAESGQFVQGSVLSLTASANADYKFLRWADGVTTASRSYTVVADDTLEAVFALDEVEVYTVSAVAENGRVEGAGQYEDGTDATLTAVANTGYHFAGWADGVTTASRTFTVEGNASYEALFEANSYAIAIVAAHGTVEGATTGNYAYGTELTLTAAAAEGYEFASWADGDTAATITYTVAGADTIVAEFNPQPFNLTFVAENGRIRGAENGVYDYDTKLTLSAIADNDYKFLRWSDGATTASRSYTVHGDDTVEAFFTARAVEVYTISAIAKNGTVTGTGTFTENEETTLTATAKEGYHFVGWSDSVATESRVVKATENKTYTALFAVDTYTITLSAENGRISGAESGVFNNGTRLVLRAVANTNFKFIGWSDGETKASRSYTVVADDTLTALFESTLKTINVVAVNGSVSGADSTGIYALGTNLTLVATANTGYSFAGWSDGETSATRNITVTDNATYTALFEIESYAVRFVAENGNISGAANGEFNYGTVLTLTASANSGYKFLRWADGEQSATRTVTIVDTVTLTALFASESVTVYTISAVAENGSVEGVGQYEAGATATLTAVANTGYKFIGWSDAVTTATRSFTVSGAASFTALFTAESYAINISAAHGSISGAATGSYTYGTELTLTATAATGYHFAGWADGDTLATRAYTVAGTASLTALFEPNSYNITLVAGENGKVRGAESGAFNYDTKLTLSAIADNGYKFLRWSDGETKASRSYTVVADDTLTAYFTERAAEVYTISVVAQNGTVTGAGTFVENEETTLTAIANEGYLFAGWSDGVEDSARVVKATANMTFTALFNAITYNVTLVAGTGGQITGAESGDYTLGTELVLRAKAATGYKFIGWSDGEAASSRRYTVVADDTLKANFKYDFFKISIVADGGRVAGVDTTSGYSEGTVLTLTARANAGYKFIGWSDSVATTSRNIIVTSDASYTALFEIQSYAMAFTATNGTITGAVDSVYNYGTQLSLTAVPATGYRFVRWSDGVRTAERIYTVSLSDTLSAVFTACWYQIDVVAVNGTVTGAEDWTYTYGTELELKAIANTGYKFTRWADGVTTETRSYTVAGNDTLEAVFVSDVVTLYTVSALAENGKVEGAGQYQAGDTVTLKAVANDGYSFLRWADGVADATRTIIVAADVEVEAIFVANVVVRYNVSAVAENGKVEGIGKYVAGDTATLKAVANDGYSFLRWADDVADSVRTVVVTSDTTFTALFVSDSVTVYTVSAIAENGTVTGTGIYTLGDTVTLTAIANDGYTFLRWTDGVTDSVRTIVVTADVEVEAVFASNAVTLYTVSAVAENGKVEGIGQYQAGDTATLTAVANDGYRFLYWSDNLTDSVRTVVVTSDTTFTALFISDSVEVYTIAVVAENGTVTGAGIYAAGDTVTLTATPKAGYRFVQWSDNTTANPYVFNVISDVMLTAQFEPVQYMVMAIGNNGTVTGGGVYNAGTAITLTAAPNIGYRFIGWSDGNTDNPRNVVVNSDLALTALFEAITAIDDEAEAAVNIFAFGNTIVVENATDDIFVFDANGRLVAMDRAIDQRTEIQIANTGVYIVKTGATAKRVVVNQR